jgi:hypothetical protein
MCEPATADRIQSIVRSLPESEARKVLDFAESLISHESTLLDVVKQLPKIEGFSGDPVKIQREMRDEWP